jgi:hypothetical protein
VKNNKNANRVKMRCQGFEVKPVGYSLYSGINGEGFLMGEYLNVAFFDSKFIMLLIKFRSFLKYLLKNDLMRRDEDLSHRR